MLYVDFNVEIYVLDRQTQTDRQMYANVGHLVCQLEEETVLINSEEGVHQGDPLGPVISSFTIHPVLKQLQLQHNKVHI